MVEKAIEKLFVGQEDLSKDEIEEIVLDSKVNVPSFTPEDAKYLEGFKNLLMLSMNLCGLKSLSNLPKIDLLRVRLLANIQFDLNDNQLTGKELSKLSIYPNLQKLKLAGNKIESLDDLKELKPLSNLSYLDLTGCPVSEDESALKKFAFDFFPKLISLNGYDKDGESVYSEEDDDDEDGEYDYEDDDEELEDEEYEGDSNEENAEDYDDEDEDDFEGDYSGDE